MPTPAQVIGTYIHAKDGNRPCLMPRAFVDDVALEMVVKTDAISFPASASGLDAITDVLIRRFVQDYENVYTFCLAWDKRPAAGGSDKKTSKFPPTSKGEEKYSSLAEKTRMDARGLSFLTPGSTLYRLVAAHQAHTEGGDGSADWSL